MAKKPTTALLMHPVVTDELFRGDHFDALERVCNLVSTKPFRDLDTITPHLDNIEILITSWGCPRITEAVVAEAPRLKLIAHLAGSVKGFIDDVAWRRGIKVVNAVAANAVPVAEYTLAAILMSNKKVFQLREAYRQLKENRSPWTKEAPNAGNYKKTIGIVGASNVGRLVIEHLNHFDFRTLVYDPYLTPMDARQLGAHKVGLAELCSQADVVSIHAPLLADTHHLISGRELALMKNGATLINTARGAIVNAEALLAELEQGRLYAVLDVTDPEDLPASSRLFHLPNVFLTPHIAGSLGDETQRLTDYIVDELERYTKGQTLKHLVRREHLSRLA